jgi:TM2 domain-containing membrane protein YozV
MTVPQLPSTQQRFCRNCGKDLPLQAVACVACGLPPDAESKFCPACGTPTDPRQVVCVKCGVALRAGGAVAGEKSKVAAGILGILLGSLGIHKFYLGYSKEGGIMLAVTLLGALLTAGIAGFVVAVIGLIEGIIYLTKPDAEFARIYVQGRRGWF